MSALPIDIMPVIRLMNGVAAGAAGAGAAGAAAAAAAGAAAAAQLLLLLLCYCSAEAAVRRVLPCPGLAPASFGFTFGSAKKLKEQHKTFAR